MGLRFALAGGRESWARTLLTAVGVGLGVALLLITTAFPSAWGHRQERERDRTDITYSAKVPPKADDTLLIADTGTTYRSDGVRGRLVQPEGPKAPLPPGVAAFPRPGEMAVSPALKKLLASDDGALLRQRLPYRITGTIADQGLVGPSELAYYAGTRDLHVGGPERIWNVQRISTFGKAGPTEGLDPVLTLLVLMVFIVLLMPVAVFIATAVRFGGERRDRRLAALRLVGADGLMARRIAGGEALAGAVVGLVLGAVFFVILRQLAGRITLFDTSVFPSDLNPSPGLAVLVALAVPAAAVAVTLLALRNVVIEPLGVVRKGKPPRRRLWWRLLLPLGGLVLLYPMIGQGREQSFNEWMVIGGTVLLLIGVTALLPWVVEAVVNRLGGGAVSWQLAVRRLQLSSGTAARMVNGIGVAVAGAIALQMLFAGVSGDYTRQTKNDLNRAQMTVHVPATVPLADADRALRATRGVRHTTAFGTSDMAAKAKDPENFVSLSVGDCSALRELARLSTCHDGDVFVVTGAEYDTTTAQEAKPGRTLYVDPSEPGSPGREAPWRLPAAMKAVPSKEDPTGVERGGVLATPSALPHSAAATADSTVYVRVDPSDPDARDRVRNTAAKADPLADVFVLAASEQSNRFASVRTGLFVGATCVLILIGASLLVSQLEQLRERRKLLSVLVAFGTRRRTLSLSVFWQTAVPIALGLVLASLVGLTLGAVLLKMVDATVTVDWASVGSMTGIGAGVVLAVTALSLPPLLRMMRPDGLRTE
ncbi:ABC transporter permease [Streptomyces sp. TS71-3]|uniref:ABC transporter permease n=1 Tax=Streptomyces sp. TS71-3 TaxID=2733862 RepID=UPI001BB37FC9|nr:ABC transporter permease [Streptomyces sp. TS71-3]